jgi:hypothetical protein
VSQAQRGFLRRLLARGGLAAVVAWVAVCSWVLPGSGGAQVFVPGSNEAFPRIRYGDGRTSVNDRCIVRQAKLSPAIRPVYVNGRPIGFC